MKRWLIHNYAQSKEVFKMYKRIIKSNNTLYTQREYNKLFILEIFRSHYHKDLIFHHIFSLLSRMVGV